VKKINKKINVQVLQLFSHQPLFSNITPTSYNQLNSWIKSSPALHFSFLNIPFHCEIQQLQKKTAQKASQVFYKW